MDMWRMILTAADIALKSPHIEKPSRRAFQIPCQQSLDPESTNYFPYLISRAYSPRKTVPAPEPTTDDAGAGVLPAISDLHLPPGLHVQGAMTNTRAPLSLSQPSTFLQREQQPKPPFIPPPRPFIPHSNLVSAPRKQYAKPYKCHTCTKKFTREL